VCRILRYSSAGPVKSFCHHRLVLLEQKFNLHVMINSDKEFLAQKSAPHRWGRGRWQGWRCVGVWVWVCV
jgi:AMP deaminase